MNIEDKWAILENCAIEMADTSLSIEEREFAAQRAMHILDIIKVYYIGGNTND